MAADVDVYGVVSVGLNSAGDIVLSIVEEGAEVAILSTTAARKLVEVLTQASKVSEAQYAANVKQARLEAEIARLQAKLAEKVAALGA